MESKYSPEIESEINFVLDAIRMYRNLFSINVEYFIDGWAIFLKEKFAYPRCIVIFKSNKHLMYSLKSYEIVFDNYDKERYNELYFIENLKSSEELLKELKNVIYGKDILNLTFQKLNEKKFS
ncbi:MAG: hypothetical protein ACFFAO_15965 [Candidatus Hermodarchaeota archaeon]